MDNMKRKKPKMDFKALKRVLGLLFKYYKKSIIFVVFCILLSAISSISGAVFLERLVGGVIQPGLKYGFDYVKKDLFILIAIMGGIYLTGLICSYLYNRIMAVVTQEFLCKLRIIMFNGMQDLPISFFDRNQHGDIMSTYTNDVDSIRQLISQSIPQLFNSIIVVTSLFCVMLYYSLWLALIVFVAIIIMFFTSKFIAGYSAIYFISLQKTIGRVEGFIEEMMHGQKVVKVFNHEEEAIKDFDEINGQFRLDSENANKFANILMPVIHNIGNILYVFIAVAGAIFVTLNVTNVSLAGIRPMEIAVVVAFLPMSRQFSNQVGNVSQQINSIVMGLAGAMRIFNLIDQEKEVDNGYVTLVNIEFDENNNIIETTKRTNHWAWRHPHQDGTLTYTELKGDIRMFDVDFGYYPDKIVLHDVSIYAKPGQKIAFVGATGAGKTTITNLLNRFYDIADGKIRYDGININKIKKSDLRKSIGIVLQDTNLFTGTVMENIRYGRLDATDEEVMEAAKIANAYDFITRLPDGFNTMLTSDGANLSQGQRQLISIARAAVADAPVMILDEATSSIDTRTELLVQKGTDKLMEGRTVFVIAHRLSTVQNSNAIMVLDHGRIIERGDHDDLIMQKGIYYQLYTGAFELE